MALIECPDCQAKISDQANNCIGCGFPLKKLNPATLATRHVRLLGGNPHYAEQSQKDRTDSLSGNLDDTSASHHDQTSSYKDRSQQQVVKSVVGGGVNMSCPKCQGEDWKLASLVHSEGLQTINSTTSGGGIGIGTGGLGGAIGSSNTTGIQQTITSQLAAPPMGMTFTTLFFAGFFVSFVLCLFSRTWLLLAIPCAIGVLLSWSVETNTRREAISVWRTKRMCTRCGHFYLPENANT